MKHFDHDEGDFLLEQSLEEAGEKPKQTLEYNWNHQVWGRYLEVEPLKSRSHGIQDASRELRCLLDQSVKLFTRDTE
ncbi:hypothetical protein PsorP6_014284 [Peronosclerospora sorghi]|uniref:Uncharacterized protein n=1 Tax=Peronosclerospora sorghi TaxID=230839 RepID=A0ACC0VFK7_9STRA|nr:hypothetical protein PsorP6_014284 [Peronosclerospora sorghi]